MKQFMNFIAASAVAMGIAGAVSAQSTYSCSDLDGFHSLPSVEGTEGVFFRVTPELKNFHPFSDETVEDMAKLSRAFQQQGTQLVFLPMPTKSMVMVDYLPQRAYDYGFEPVLAATVYDDMIKRLREAGVTVADARQALSVGANSAMPYFRADYRLNSYGAQLVAQSVARAAQGGGAGGGFMQPMGGAQATGVAFRQQGTTNAAEGTVEIKSEMRNILQRFCMIELPKVTTQAVPAPAQAANTGGGFNRGPAIVVAGSEYTGTPEIGFGTQMGQALGGQVQIVSVAEAGPFAAISAYVTSDAFLQARPRVLVWEVPVYKNLAQYGDQPFAELTAMASGNCRIPVPVQSGLDANTAQANLASLDPNGKFTLFLETGGSSASEARFTFTSRSGFQRTRTVTREGDLDISRTGRFAVPMTGLWAEGVTTLDIKLDAGFGSTPRLTACQI